jgi:hypothetical protein
MTEDIKVRSFLACLYSSFSHFTFSPPSFQGLAPLTSSHFGINLELEILQAVGRTPWTGDQPVAKGHYLHEGDRNTEKT